MDRMIAGTAVAAALLLLQGVVCAQNLNLENRSDIGRGTVCVMMLLGVDTPEDLDESEVESLSVWLESPLEINFASEGRLVSSGLFTPYRAASLADYRSRHGDVLSLEELAAVDGFPEDFVRALAPFISLRSSASAGMTSGRDSGMVVKNFITVRSSVRSVGGLPDYSYGLKYRLDVNDSFQFGLSANRGLGGTDGTPEGGSFYLAYYGRGSLGKIVLGDYRLRYGQGLLLWSGFRMESSSSPESFCARSSGISPYWSFTGEDSSRGVAADFSIGRFSMSSSVAVNGLREMMAGRKDVDLSLEPAVNLSWYGKRVRVGVTGCCTTGALNAARRAGSGRSGGSGSSSGEGTGGVSAAGCSADFRWCPRGTDVFGEVASDLMTMKVRALLGTMFRISDSSRMAVRATYSEDEYTLSAGGSLCGGRSLQLSGKSGFGSSAKMHSGSFGFEGRWYPGRKYGADGPNWQVKTTLNYVLQFSPTVSLAARYALRLRSAGEKSRNDLRVDLRYADGAWSAVFRMNALYNKALGLLSYAEGGWNPGRMSLYLRAGIFRIDNWADRIYVYERDAPGNYNVPAYYGRGFWAAFTAGIRAGRVCRLYLRVSTLQYPWESPTASVRIPKTEAKLMAVIDL